LHFNSFSEKSVVLNMIKMAACGEFGDFPTRPQTSDSQFCYVWAPKNSQSERGVNHHAPQDGESAAYNYPYHQSRHLEEKVGGLSGPPDDSPFKLPENDTIIQTAHRLSRLASRNSTRTGMEGGRKGLDRQPDDDIDKLLAQQVSQHSMKSKRQRSASLHLPSPNGGQRVKTVRRARSRSVGRQDNLPPIPVKVSVTKETVHGKPGSGSARLRYTSHWET
jgi:hypothetical protein